MGACAAVSLFSSLGEYICAVRKRKPPSSRSVLCTLSFPLKMGGLRRRFGRGKPAQQQGYVGWYDVSRTAEQEAEAWDAPPLPLHVPLLPYVPGQVRIVRKESDSRLRRRQMLVMILVVTAVLLLVAVVLASSTSSTPRGASAG